jgi:hypothetical protein
MITMEDILIVDQAVHQAIFTRVKM